MTELERLLRNQWVRRDGSVDEHMVSYCMKSDKYIDTGPYYLNIGNAKPTIDSTMWYDDETEGPDSSKFEAFRNYNLRTNGIRSLEDDAENGRTQVWTYANYSQDKSGGKLRGWLTTRNGVEPNHVGEYRAATPDDMMAINQGVAQIKADYEKRLKTYWKRYSNKVHASGYWANR